MLPSAAVLATIAFVASLFFPAWRSTLAAAAALLLFTVVGSRVTAWAASRRARSSMPFEHTRRVAPARPERPPDLEALERTLSWRRYSSRDFDHRVRPLLRRLVRYKLLAARGIDLDAHPDAARALLPPRLTWATEDGPAGEPDEVVTTARIARLLDDIEAL